jgi:hypothetical protein
MPRFGGRWQISASLDDMLQSDVCLSASDCELSLFPWDRLKMRMCQIGWACKVEQYGIPLPWIFVIKPTRS